ncbi:hypothetical protein SDC9_109916 [bioreactor metagenome]|uniref:Uncharacterized protein n=1 Tax=bioreactor metagenome TaxID=1076179 RepID=A0A645BDB0_9ZZZZ
MHLVDVVVYILCDELRSGLDVLCLVFLHEGLVSRRKGAEEALLKLALLRAYILDHVGMLEVGPVSHKVESPEGRILVELRAVVYVERLREALRSRVDRHIDRRVRLIKPEPENGRDLFRHVGTDLAYHAV